MRHTPICLAALLVAAVTLILTGSTRADFPKPSPYPISWELKFDHSKAKRLTVTLPGASAPQAFWYMTYTVTNDTGEERTFLPAFEMETKEGGITRSDKNISPKVLDAIRERERNHALQSSLEIGGELRVGDDQAKEGVAIWPEPEPRMGTFVIYISGLSGEIAQLKDGNGEVEKDKDGQPIILRKTLELTYQVPGDEVHPAEDAVNAKGEQWVMR